MNQAAVHNPLLDDITAVVVTFNSAHCIANLVKTLQSFPHIVIVDNASNDDSVASLQARLPQARIVQSKRNLGFGAANNRGLAETYTPYVLLLNPDCSLSLQSLTLLKKWLQKGASVAVPQLMNPEGVQYRPELSYRPSEFSWRSHAPLAEGPLCVEFACAACWLACTEVLRSVGGFDERFFLYYEDDDLCLRLRAAAHEIVVEPAAQAQHVSGGSSTPGIRSLWVRSFHLARSKILLTAFYRGTGVALLRRLLLFIEALLGLVLKPLLLDRVGTVRSAARLWGALSAPWFAKNHNLKKSR